MKIHLTTMFVAMTKEGARFDDRIFNQDTPLSKRMIDSTVNSMLESELAYSVKVETWYQKIKPQ